MKKRTIILWSILCVFLSACVYLTLPSSCNKDKPAPEKLEQAAAAPEEIDYDSIVEAYFAARPVRDVPKEADLTAFLVGTYAKNHRDFKTAADAYAKVLKTDPQNKEVKENLYLYFVLSGRVDQALPYAYQVLDDAPNELLPLMVILSENVRSQDFQSALQTVDKAKSSYQSFLSPLLKAWIYTGLNDKDQALKTLDALKGEESLQAAYLLHRALILDYFGQTRAAAQSYGELMKRNETKNVRVLLLLKDFETRTHALTDKKSFALQYATLSDESFISKEMMTSPGDGERVRTPIQGISWVFFDIASAMGQSANLDLSLFFANLALYLNPNSSITQLFMGEVLEELQLLDQANALYATVKPDQNIFLSVQMRAIINQIKTKQIKSAIQSLNALIKVYPKAALFHMTLGDAYREEGDYKKAFEAYQNAKALANPYDKQTAPIYFYQGVCKEALGEKKEAIALFEQALKLDPENPLYLNYAGYLWLEQNENIPMALEMIQKAVAKAPNDGSILDSLGWAYYLMGDYDKALPILERAVTLEAGNAVLNSHLGDVYWRLGRFREARFQWAHAASLKEGLTPDLQAQLEEKIKMGLK